uniref:Ribosomal protein L5 n=1 Tax=Micractinium pusillum TaxID=126839 RepID=A0A650F1V6_9CHLO|nr:ribosomal protein L5 [Micractinium pusillum]
MTVKNPKHLLVLKNNLPYQTPLSQEYEKRILTYDLILKQNYTNIMQLPRLDKIVLNTTSKRYVTDKKEILFTVAALELLSGQKTQLTYARKSVANFKIRQDQILGCKVVLHENLMYAFLEKLSRIILPRFRDFTPKKIHTQNNLNNGLMGKRQSLKCKKFIAYTFGLKNLMLFPELENHYELVENFRGMNLTFVFSMSHQKNFPNKSDTLNLKKNSLEKELALILSGFQIPLY